MAVRPKSAQIGAGPQKRRSTSTTSGNRKKFASWKFDIEKAMLFDGRLNGTAFRIGVYLLSCVNAEKKTAYVTDETISLLVPRCKSRTTIYNARNQLRDTGWIDFQEGRSGRATTYRFNDKNVNPILDVVADKRDCRDEQRQKRRLNGQQSNVH